MANFSVFLSASPHNLVPELGNRLEHWIIHKGNTIARKMTSSFFKGKYNQVQELAREGNGQQPSQREQSSRRHSSTGNSVKLPKLEIPSFSGEKLKLAEFLGLF